MILWSSSMILWSHCYPLPTYLHQPTYYGWLPPTTGLKFSILLLKRFPSFQFYWLQTELCTYKSRWHWLQLNPKQACDAMMKVSGEDAESFETMNCHTILSAGGPSGSFLGFPVKDLIALGRANVKTDDKVQCIWVWPWKSAATTAVGALH